MKRFMSLISSGVEGLEFPDLLISNEQGFKHTVKIKRGEFIPADRIEAGALERSLTTGCLGNAIRAGWVIILEEGQTSPILVDKPDEEKKAEFQKQQAEKQREVDLNANKSQAQMANEYKKEYLQTVIVEDGSKIVVGSPRPEAPKVEPKVETKVEAKVETKTEVDTLESFSTLQHFAKLSFISKSTDINILKEISEKAGSKQLRNNALKRLKTLS